MESLRIISFDYNDKENFNLANAIRTRVFVEEQKVDQRLEFDQYESDARHYLVFINDVPVATARWRETKDGVKLERFAVEIEYRNKGIAKHILQEVLKDTLSLKKKIYLNSQVSALGFYQKYGFKSVGDKFIEADIEHYKMVYQP